MNITTHVHTRSIIYRVASPQEESNEELIVRYLPLAHSIAKKYEHRGVDLDDLVQEGTIGLMYAAQKFDRTLSIDFSVYATWWVRNAVLRAVFGQSRAIRIPHNRVTMTYRLVHISRRLQQELGREPTPKEIAEQLPEGTATPEMIADLLKEFQLRDIESINVPLGSDSDETLADTLVDDEQNPEDLFLQRRENEKMVQLFHALNPDERLVIALRFGLTEGKEHSYSEIARRIQKNQKTVAAIEERAMLKLRRAAHYLEREHV